MTALATIQAHRLIRHSAEDAPECSCGDWEPETATRDLEEHDEHVAAMLTALVSQEALEEVLLTHNIECTGPGEVTCRGCRDRGWMSWVAYRRHIADAVLALLNGGAA